MTSVTEQDVAAEQGFHSTADLRRSAHRARLEQQAERNRKNLQVSERARFWFAVRIALACVAGCLIGFIPMAWALHTTDIEKAGIAWSAGPVVGMTLVVATLLAAAVKWERDDW